MFANVPRPEVGEDRTNQPLGKPVAKVGTQAQRPKTVAACAKPRPMKRPGRTTPSLIGQGMALVGKIVTSGDASVNGEVQGDVQSRSLIVGKSGQIFGIVVAEDVEVHGHVKGEIYGLRVALHEGSRVEGDVHHRTLAIQDGALFEGKSHPVEDPFAEKK